MSPALELVSRSSKASVVAGGSTLIDTQFHWLPTMSSVIEWSAARICSPSNLTPSATIRLPASGAKVHAGALVLTETPPSSHERSKAASWSCTTRMPSYTERDGCVSRSAKGVHVSRSESRAFDTCEALAHAGSSEHTRYEPLVMGLMSTTAESHDASTAPKAHMYVAHGQRKKNQRLSFYYLSAVARTTTLTRSFQSTCGTMHPKPLDTLRSCALAWSMRAHTSA